MGNFRLVIDAVGGHGDCREPAVGEALTFPETGIDRACLNALELVKAAGGSIVAAELVHWPGQAGEVVDDLVSMTRKHGSFKDSSTPPTKEPPPQAA